MNISMRIKQIAACVKYDTVCDIGTDHGYLLIYLANEKSLKHGAACDVNSGPLGCASRNVEAAKMSAVIETRLGYGLSPVLQGEFECCVVAGMGGMLILEILSADLLKAKSFEQLVLSPHRECDSVRRFLHASGMRITDEHLIFDAGKWYNIIDCRVGNEAAYNEAGYLFGQRLIKRQDILLKEFLEREIEKTQKLLTLSNKSVKTKDYHEKCVEAYKWL